MEGLGKVCTKCKQEKAWDEFGKNKGKKDGHESWCRDCVSKHKQKYHTLKKKKDKYRREQEMEILSVVVGKADEEMITDFCNIFKEVYRELRYQNET